MLNPTKNKIFSKPNYLAINNDLLERYSKKVRMITTCPDCKAIVGLNAFGFMFDKLHDKPEAIVYGCRECEHLFIAPVFV